MIGTEARGVVAAYLLLRKAIGWIGILLPVVLVVGYVAFTSAALPDALSDYYFTPMRNILEGTLSVLGVFLVAYDVGVLAERWVTNVAGVGVLGVAFFPGTNGMPGLSTAQRVAGDLHLFWAGVTFVALSVAMWRFARADSDGPGAPAPSRGAATFYRASSGVMLGFVVLSGVASVLPRSVRNATKVEFIFEALAVMTFGIVWLVKGRALQPLLSAPGIPLTQGLRQGARGTAAPGELPAVSSARTDPAPSPAQGTADRRAEEPRMGRGQDHPRRQKR
jgi:hypothetical protein